MFCAQIAAATNLPNVVFIKDMGEAAAAALAAAREAKRWELVVAV